jgi:hypothetical protein
MLIRNDAFGTVGTAGSIFAKQNLGRTETHEVGHYFNLAHIWGKGAQGDPTCGDDYVDDECMLMVTNGQATRMRAALEGPRKGLLTSEGITGLRSTDVLNGVTVYPNPPNSGEFSIDLDGQIDLIKVSDSYGRVTLEKTINKSNYKIDLSAYSNGIYYLELTFKGLTATQKIVKK